MQRHRQRVKCLMHYLLETSQQFYDMVLYYQPHLINEEIKRPNASKNLHVKATSIKLSEFISPVIHSCNISVYTE